MRNNKIIRRYGENFKLKILTVHSHGNYSNTPQQIVLPIYLFFFLLF